MNDISPITGGDIIERVVAMGDLDKLTPEERVRYYSAVCTSIGLNPLTQPFSYIRLNGKLTLYAAKGCTDQLRTSRGVSVEDMSETERDGVFVVTCKVKDRDGRTDMAKGAVPIGGLKGEALANAIMKAETKAKRRATLSLCGLGMLDESELETIPATAMTPVESATAANGNRVQPQVKPLPKAPEPQEIVEPETGEVSPHLIKVGQTRVGQADWIGWGATLVAAVTAAPSMAEVTAWVQKNVAALTNCERDAPKIYERIDARIREARDRLKTAEADFIPAAEEIPF